MNESASALQPDQRFPTLERECWLNHAAISPWPKPVIDAMAQFVDDNARAGPTDYRRWLQVESGLRDRLAELLGGVNADDIALLENTSAGLNLVAGGLDWRPGDRVVIAAGEFPSNRLPWLALASHGVEVIEVELPEIDPEAALVAAINPRTRLLAVSAVRYDTGLRLDLPRLGEACRRHGARLCVDAIQQVGALPLEVESAGIDFLACGGHKWLLSPEGIGFFWASPRARGEIDPSRHGWRMCPQPFNFDKHDWQAADDARQFEIGTLNTAGIHALHAATGLLLEQGMQQVGKEVLEKSGWLRQALAEISGIDVVTPAAAQRRAGIISFRHRRHTAATVHERLLEHGIHSAVRGSLLRLSPHFYTPISMLEGTAAQIRALG